MYKCVIELMTISVSLVDINYDWYCWEINEDDDELQLWPDYTHTNTCMRTCTHTHTHIHSLANIVNYTKELKCMNVKCINIVVSELGVSCNASNFVVKLTSYSCIMHCCIHMTAVIGVLPNNVWNVTV